MRRVRRVRRAALAGVVVAVGSLLLSGCIRMPTEGAIVNVEAADPGRDGPNMSYDPPPPRAGASASDVVLGFLEAMKATPIKTSVARQFLTERAQRSWRPEQGIITYTDTGSPVGQQPARVYAGELNYFDSRGAWTHRVSGPEAELTFDLSMRDGEWRIDRAPDALMVPESWFNDRYRRMSLYWFDPAGTMLVPEPVFVPEGDQMATALVRGLLSGPPRSLRRVARSYLGTNLSLELSVPITSTGTAELALDGQFADPEGAVTDAMAAQLAWTLRQEPRIRGIRITRSGVPVALPGGATTIRPDAGAMYDPAGIGAVSELFGLRDGRLVGGRAEALEPTTGRFGVATRGLSEVAVNLAGTMAAGVVAGRRLLLAPTGDGDTPTIELVSDGTRLLDPAWDGADRLWFIDVAATGARIGVYAEGRVRYLTAPGLQGRDVRRFLVSRDGSRLVALLAEPGRARVVVSRIAYVGGVPSRILPTEQVDLGSSDAEVIDIGWQSPTSVGVLSRVGPDLSQIRTVAVDGSPIEFDALGSVRVRGASTALISSPASGDHTLVRIGRDLTDISDPARTSVTIPGRVISLGYVG